MKILTPALLAASTIFAVTTNAFAVDKIDNCEVTGKKGSIKIEKLAQAGQLTFESNLPAPVWYNGDTPETIKDGMEYCMAAEIAWRAGVDKIKLVPVDWDAMIAGQTHDFDLALSEISITDERKKVHDFSLPYFNSDIGVLTRTETPLDGTTLKKAKIGVQQATTGAEYATGTLKIADAQVYPDAGSMFAALGAGQIDAAITDTSIVLAQEVEGKGKFKVVGQYATGETYGAIYPKGNANNAAFDKIIAAMVADGTMKKLSTKYLASVWGKDPATIPYFKP